MAIHGIQFVTDADGNRVAVQLDLREWGELWEDIYDNIVADSRKGETTVPLDKFEAELLVTRHVESKRSTEQSDLY